MLAAAAASSGTEQTVYNLTTTAAYIGDRGTRVVGAGGGTLSISKAKEVDVSGSITGTTSADAGVIFAQASASLAVTVGLTASTTTTVAYSWKVPSSETSGWIELGTQGYRIAYVKGYIQPPCTWVTESSGTVWGATKTPYFMNSDKYASTLHD